MFVTPSHTDHPTVNRHAIVTDGPIVSAHRADGKLMRVERVRITYQWSSGNQLWNASKYSTDVSGPVLKKDGTDSQLDATIRYYGETPAWIAEIVDRLRPHGLPVIPVIQFEVEQSA